eukprot:g1224.t1
MSSLSTKGKLKLKGGLTVKSGKIVKNKKRKQKIPGDLDQAAVLDEEFGEGGIMLPSQTGDEDRRTPAEKKFEEKMIKRERHQSKTQVLKSHREKVKEFNEYLAKLTEHHDIPKVGPG